MGNDLVEVDTRTAVLILVLTVCFGVVLIRPIHRWVPCGDGNLIRRVRVPMGASCVAFALLWVTGLHIVGIGVDPSAFAMVGCVMVIAQHAFSDNTLIDLEIRTTRTKTHCPPKRLAVWVGNRTHTIDAQSPTLADVPGYPEMALGRDVLAHRPVTSMLPCRDGRTLLGIRSLNNVPTDMGSTVVQKRGSVQSLVDLPGILESLTALDSDEQHFVARLVTDPNQTVIVRNPRGEAKAAVRSNILDLAHMLDVESGTQILDFIVFDRGAKRILAAACFTPGAMSGGCRLLLFDAQRLILGRMRPFASVDTDSADARVLFSVKLLALRDGRILCVHRRLTDAPAAIEHNTVAIHLDIGDKWQTSASRVATRPQRASFTLVSADMRVVHVENVYTDASLDILDHVDVLVSAPLPLAGKIAEPEFKVTRLPACDVRMIGSRLVIWKQGRFEAIDIAPDGALQTPRPFPSDLFRSACGVHGYEMKVRVLSDSIFAVQVRSTLVVLDAETCAVVGVRHWPLNTGLLFEPRPISAAERVHAMQCLAACMPVLPHQIAALVSAYLL